MTLLLGPPGCGKTTLLQALTAKLDQSLKVEGEISYNGYKLNEFVPQKTSVYISQYDQHISEMTVRETLDFSARCQGIGGRADIMKEISRREKEAGIVPEPDIDTYMKATSVEGLKRTLQTDYILKILGLDICADTMVGDAMRRGISGGQKKRLTTGEMIIGPTKALFMDEISNGLDSSTTFQIVRCMQQLAHITKSTMLVSLLQPAPETYDLFDDIILMAEGEIVYHGPRDNVLEFFEHCGFRCPPRKGIADFLQEKLEGELSRPLQKSESHKNALSFSIYSLRKWELFKACMDREWLLMKRNLSLHVFKSVQVSSSNITLGQQILESRGLYFNEYFYWIPLGALIGFWIIFNIGFTCALSYSKEMILPCEPITISFQNVQYFVDTPKILRKQGLPQKRLQLLHDITGAFRPGILTALMGVSGAGKTTLMDVLSGRKTGGIIEGEIRIGGYPKAQKTYARISGYCEQTDIHSPQITVEESVMYSAWLRLPAQIDKRTRSEFVAEVIEMIELGEIRDELVGIPGVSGISTEQRKRLTIAVELVSNPSVIFMDEPTSGLDARAAAIVMRVAKNIVNTNRTVVCTIHQPSIDVFEAFDELILMKRGGQIIYSGELGQNSSKLIEYFEGIPGVPKIKENYNPATWMLEVTGSSMEARLGLDFANLYRDSHLFQKNEELVARLGLPEQGSKELHFSTRFPQNAWKQFKACLWKQEMSYWRSPKYNLVRLIFIIVSSLIFGALLWQKGQKINDEQDFFNILGSIFIFIQFAGIANCSSVMPFVATERTIVYRERFAGMYSSWAYSSAQVVVEIPYILLQALLFLIITYPAINFYWSAYKVFWYFYSMFCSLLYFNYLGLLLVSLTPNVQMASIWASFVYTTTNLFSGFLVPEPIMPRWWAWGYWICPTAWSLKGLLTSQYGDIEEEITAYGERKSISSFLRSYFGYKHDDLGVVAIVLLAFPVFFALAFAITIAKLNFQKRSILAALFLGSSEDYPRYAIYVDTMDSINLGEALSPNSWATVVAFSIAALRA
uniref:Pleiotropic drug resistance protein 3-like n=1 Tax=Populus alba TaxID=43335 RepID=A0A4V6A5F9_POPAL|nr:pleiotropic drug resistance protein 3-like [Populus alba]